MQCNQFDSHVSHQLVSVTIYLITYLIVVNEWKVSSPNIRNRLDSASVTIPIYYFHHLLLRYPVQYRSGWHLQSQHHCQYSISVCHLASHI